jgi:hypothetical protein
VMPAIRWGAATLLFALAPTWTGTFGTLRHVAMSRWVRDGVNAKACWFKQRFPNWYS